MNIIKKYWLGAILLVLVALSALMIYVKLHPKELPSNLVAGTGRMDGDLLNLNIKYPGRVQVLHLQDGQKIHQGEILARLGSPEFEARKKAAQEQIEAKSKELLAKKIEYQIAQTSIPQKLVKAQAALSAKDAQEAAFKRQIAAQKELLSQDQREYDRYRSLYLKALIPKERWEQIKLRYDLNKKKLQALQEQRIQIHQAVAIAQSDLKDAQAAQKKLEALAKGIQALQKGIQAMKAQKEEIEAMIAQMRLHAPFDGFCVEKIANVGEVVGAGMPVATLLDPKSLYLKIFVDTLENGKIKLGDKAVIFLDAWPKRPIEAKVVNIAQKAEFTPKEVSVRSDRIQRVFAVHLKPLHPNPLLKLGIPAIGVITLDGKALPRSLNELPPL